MSESETDIEFVSDMEWLHSYDREAALPPEKLIRLFALARRGAEAADEIERLKVKNIQMQAALGYAICADDERHIIPENPFKCGVCDANKGLRAEIERLRAALKTARPFIGWAGHYPTILAEIDAALKEDGDE